MRSFNSTRFRRGRILRFKSLVDLRIGASAAFEDKLYDFPSDRILTAGFQCLLCGKLGIQPIDLIDLIPNTDRKDRLDRIIYGAEKAVVHPHGKAELLRRQDRLRIRNFQDLL